MSTLGHMASKQRKKQYTLSSPGTVIRIIICSFIARHHCWIGSRISGTEYVLGEPEPEPEQEHNEQ